MIHSLQKFGLFLILTVTLLTGCSDEPLSAANQERFGEEVPVIAPASYRELSSFLSGNQYNWESVDQGVPAFILETLPPDMHTLAVRAKKELFFLSLLPMVLMVNEEIDQQRQEVLALLELHEDTGELTSTQHFRLLDLAEEYGLKEDPLVDPLARRSLLKRLDILPPSLVLAQAATESGYGTSRFALEGNNLFGQRTSSTGSGLIPLERPENESHEVRRYTTVYESLRSYMKNLNVHKAYVSLREIRAVLRERGLDLRGVDLAAGLHLYSTRGDAYISDIRTIIKGNGLSRLSSASLHKPLPGTPCDKKAKPKTEQKTFSAMLAG